MRRSSPAGWLLVVLGLVCLATPCVAGEPAIEGYADYEAMRRQLESIADSPLADLRSLGQTLGRREVYLLSIGRGKLDEKPSILVVGGVHAPHLVGSELAVRLARRMVEQGEKDEAVRKLLDRVTFYVIPRPAPDACEAFLQRPCYERDLNQRPMDDDRDGQTDEDGPDDLDGNGWITMMRVADPAGRFVTHDDDPRVMIEADPKKNQQGKYSLYVEGRDNDQDEQQNEDPAGGVAFNRNFPFRYPFFGRGA